MAEYDVTDQQRVVDELSHAANAPVEISVVAESGRLAIVRSVVEQTLYLDDWAIDDVADVVLGVDEICTQIITTSEPDRRIVISIAVGPRGVVGRIDGTLDAGFDIDTAGFGWHVVRTVTDAQSISFVDRGGRRDVTVRFAKRRNPA